MKLFREIKQRSYMRYHAFERLISSSGFTTDLDNLDYGSCIYKLGNYSFNILPIAISNDPPYNPQTPLRSAIYLHGENNPFELVHIKTDKLIKDLKLPDHLVTREYSPNFSTCFRFGFQVCSIICEAIDAVTFCNLKLGVGNTSSWFVITSGANKESFKYLEGIIEEISNIAPEEVIAWKDLWDQRVKKRSRYKV